MSWVLFGCGRVAACTAGTASRSVLLAHTLLQKACVVKGQQCLAQATCRQHLANMSTATDGSAGISSGKVEVNGVSLFYERAGSGPLPVLLMPGALGCTETDFKPQLEKLNRDIFTVVGFDPRGYGKSRPPDRDFPQDFFHRDAKDARDLMKTLGFDKFSPLGWSDGGITALILAGTYPHDVHKLVVWGANSYVSPEDKQLYENVRDTSHWSERMLAPMVRVYGKEYFEKIWAAWCSGIGQFGDKPGGNICNEEVEKISCPTLIVHGDLDAMVIPQHPLHLNKVIKGSKLIRWPKAKHNLHLRYADDFNQEVEKFIADDTAKL